MATKWTYYHSFCKATFDLRGHKAPSVDNIPMKLFYEMWQEVRDNTTNLLQETFQERCMHKDFNVWLHTLIFKIRGFAKYRPIFVL